MMRRICLAIGLTALCSNVFAKPAPLPVPLAPELPVELVLNQHELAVDVPATANAVGMQFGLIGALIGSAVQNAQVKKAEERVVPIRNALLEYRFNERVEAELRAKLASEGISAHPVIKVMATPWDAVDAQQNKQEMPLHAMVITPRYSIDSGFGSLSVSLNTAIVDRTIKSNGKVKTKILFSRNYAYHLPLMGPVAEEDSPARWAGLGAGRLGALLDQSIAQTTDMLVYDFSPAGRTDWTQKVKRETATVKGVSYAGRAVRQGDDWVWVRAGNGVFASLQGYQPVDPNAAAPVAAAATPVPMAVPATSVAAAAAAAPAVVTPADSSASAAAAAPAVATPAAITPDHTAPAAQDAGAGGK